jgi:uncharacterized membrane protein YhhN
LGGAAIGADFLRNEAFFILKPLCTIAILVFAIAYRNLSLKNYTLQIVAGLFFCLLGDCYLLIDAYFIYGLLSFLMAHLIFFMLLLKDRDGSGGLRLQYCCFFLRVLFFL